MSATWHTRPLFISSTFKDMHAERDWLQRRVFPRIEEELRKRFHHLEPIDLRLGVETATADTEEAREVLVLKVCLEEIKRSRPFLLVLLGDRYGWVPPEERMAAAAREQGFESDLSGKSVTALEIEFGIFNENPSQKQRSLFFFRKPLPYDDMPPMVAADYCDACSTDGQVRAGHQRLQRLKQKLREDNELGCRVYDYEAGWDSQAQRVTDLDAFGELVYEQLWTALDEETKSFLDEPPSTWQAQERAALAEFCEHRGRSVVGREALIDQLFDQAFRPNSDDTQWGTCIVGSPGAGKSALFSALFHRLAEKDQVLVLANAAGATASGSQVRAMLLRWIDELAGHMAVDNPLPDNPDNDDLDNTFYMLLHRAAQQQRVVVLLDALDQFEPSTRGQHMTWLQADRWPANARLMATAIDSPPAKALAGKEGVKTLKLAPLTANDAAEIGRQVWGRYHRQLNPEVLAVLTAKRSADGKLAAGNPLWLTLALEQLNLLDGDDFARADREYTGSPTDRMHALIMDTAERMPPDIEGLYGWLLSQNDKAFGTGPTRAMTVAIALSRTGWREADLLDLVPRLSPLLAPEAPAAELDELSLAALRRGFRAHLMRRGTSERLDFVHAQMRLAVERIHLNDQKHLRALHSRINDYLEELDPGDEMIRMEKMRHLIGEKNKLRAARYYAGLDASQAAADDERIGSSWTLVEWIVAGEADAPKANAHLDWLVSWLREKNLSPKEINGLAYNVQFGLLDILKNEVRLDSRRILIEQTCEALERLFESNPGNTGLQRDLSVCNVNIGDVRQNQGDLGDAIDAYETALSIIQRLCESDPGNADWQRDLSVYHNRIGEVRRDQGDLGSALNAYETALSILQRLCESDPGNTAWQHGLSVAHDRIGDVRRNQSDLGSALNAYKTALSIRQRLGESDPSNTGWQHGLSIAHSNIGLVRRDQGDLEGALDAFETDLSIIQRLCKSDPGNAGWQHQLSLCHSGIGDVRRDQGDLGSALDAFETALSIIQRLCKSDPGNAYWQRQQSLCHDKIGDVRRDQDDLDGALNAYENALSIIQRLYESDPGNVGWQRDLGILCFKIASIIQNSDATKAMTLWTKAFDLLSGMKKLGCYISNQDEDILDLLRKIISTDEKLAIRVLEEKGLALYNQGRYSEALDMFRNMEALARNDGDMDNLQRALNNVGCALQGLGKWDEALQIHKEQEVICRDCKLPSGIALALYNQAEIMVDGKGERDTALDLAKEALTIFQSLNITDSAQIVREFIKKHDPDG